MTAKPSVEATESNAFEHTIVDLAVGVLSDETGYLQAQLFLASGKKYLLLARYDGYRYPWALVEILILLAEVEEAYRIIRNSRERKGAAREFERARHSLRLVGTEKARCFIEASKCHLIVPRGRS